MNLREAFAGIKEAQEPTQPQPIDIAKGIGESKLLQPMRKAKAKLQETARPTAKSSNPDYQPLKVYAHKELRRKVQRKFEDAGGRDLSDLVEKLFTEYLKA